MEFPLNVLKSLKLIEQSKYKTKKYKTDLYKCFPYKFLQRIKKYIWPDSMRCDGTEYVLKSRYDKD